MGVQVTRDNGRNYADNIIDSLLGFNTAQTWTTSSGTGSASLDTNLFFFGDSSLKMVNTAPTTDLVVTNSVQSTIIPFDDDYQFSFYMRKDEADEFMTLEVKVFESAVLFDTQTFVLGSETTEDDVNDVWARFVSDTTYNFSKGDEITFTFNLKGKAGTSLPNTTVWIDGLMLNNASRLNAFPPYYSKPDRFKDLPDLPTSDGVYGLNVSGGTYTWNELTDDFEPSI